MVKLQLRAAPGGSKKGSRDKGPKRVGELSQDTATGVAIVKGEEDPRLKSDNEYPDWLWKLLEPRPLVSELQRLYEGPGLTLEQMRRLWLYKNKQRIKESNLSRAKS